jgi:ribosomal protein S18 acetylase RimI-like enzyme
VIVQFRPNQAQELTSVMGRLIAQLRGPEVVLDSAGLVRILSDPSVHVFGAYLKDTLVGTLTLSKSHLLSGLRARIEDVVVDESYRRRGLAGSLVRHALSFAKDLGAITIDLTSSPGRVAANALYQHLGFTRRETNVYRYEPAAQSF